MRTTSTKIALPALVLSLATVLTPVMAAETDLSKLPPAASKKGVTFDKDIKPIFADSCLRCHGAEKPRGGLRLDTLEGALKGSKDGKVIVPGSSEKSDLVISVARLDPKKAMPPTPRARRPRPGGDTNSPAGGTPPPPAPEPPKAKNLTPEQVGLIRAWIDQGAK